MMSNFREQIATGTVLVDFYVPQCNPCKKMVPILEECTSFVKVIKIDASEEYEFSSEFGISAAPTLIIFKDGKEVKRLVGLHSKEAILKALGEI